MANRFQWILTCTDDNTTYTLVKDPIGWEDLTYKLERHRVYHGIFKQFTTNIKFHNNGGGKSYVDDKYDQFDINANVEIEVKIDSTGLGDFETLFNGVLNMASWKTDGEYTTVNIDQSGIAAKLNTRANIPVPINVPILTLPGEESQKVILIERYIRSENGGVITGTYTFNNTQITQGKIYKVVTANSVFQQVKDTVTFATAGDSGPGETLGGTSIQITDVRDGELEVTFTSIQDDIVLYQVGAQVSLGQKNINTVPTVQLEMDGIGIKYQSQFRIKGNNVSGTYTFSYGEISAGHSFFVYGEDINGNIFYDSVVFDGTTTSGSGAYSGTSYLRITETAIGSIDIEYTQIYGDIELWMDDTILLEVFTPVTIDSDVVHTIPGAEFPGDGVAPGLWRSFFGFETDVVFDNFNRFTWQDYFETGFNSGAPNAATTLLPEVLDDLDEPYLEFPVTIEYDIQLTGNLLEETGVIGGLSRTVQWAFVLAWGVDLDTAINDGQFVNIYAFPNTSLSDQDHTYTFSVSEQGTFDVGANEQIFFYAVMTQNFLTGGGPGTPLTFTYTFHFDTSNLDFQITTRARETVASTVMIHEAINQVVDMIADSDGNFYSELYGRTDSEKRMYLTDGEASKRVITSGLCIRGKLDKYISTSLDQMFKNLAAIDNIGMEIDASNRLRMEKLEHFYDRDTRILTLPYVKQYEQLNENSFYYNQIEAGYGKWETEIYYKGGLDEIHAKRYYGTKVATARGTVLPNMGEDEAVSGVKNKLQIVSDLITGNYAIELTRRKNKEWSTDDFKYDNENFLIEVKRYWTGYVQFAPLGLTDRVTVYTKFIVAPGDVIQIDDSTLNDGTYTVDSSTYDFDNNFTIIVITTTVVAETATTVKVTNNTKGNYHIQKAEDILDGDIENVVYPELSREWLNMGITPARNLTNSFSKITACLQKIEGNVQFLDGEGNYKAKSKFTDDGTIRQNDYFFFTLAENANLNYADQNIRNVEPLWLPEIYRFEYPLTYQQFKTILTNPNGFIAFYKFVDDVKLGFILSMEYNLKTGMTKFDLLRMFEGGTVTMSEDGAIVISEDNNAVLTRGITIENLNLD